MSAVLTIIVGVAMILALWAFCRIDVGPPANGRPVAPPDLSTSVPAPSSDD